MINKKWLVAIGLASTLSMSSFTTYAAVFGDIQGHWAQQTIEWGKTNGYVSGYQDGNFKPDKQITEAEFTTMLIATFHLKLDPITPQKHWADDFYGYAKKMNYPLSGYDNVDARNQPISRSHVAEMVAAVNGQNLSGEEAVKYLLVNGLSHGKTSSTVDGYAGNDNLTRAEAISFIKNLLDKGLTSPQAMPSTPTNATQLDQQYHDLLKKQQTSQPVQQPTQTTTWTPGTVHIVRDGLFPSYKETDNSVTVTIPVINDYRSVAIYRTSKYKANDPRYKYIELKEGETYTFQKGDGGEIGISIAGSNGSVVESYLIQIDNRTVFDDNDRPIPLDVILKGFGVN